ncbi:hypothetical protein [Acinetobacter sp. CWB-B33]|uniref:hypothetical protein n=1 Tax=Acinetobacter sp. CWB-B33 TaxID=2815724 RepID=UPI0031FEBFCC
MIFKTPKSDRDRARNSFEKRLDVLVFIVHAGCEITVTDVLDSVLETTRMTARACLNDLVSCGYLEKTTIYKFKATEKAKQLFGVKG